MMMMMMRLLPDLSPSAEAEEGNVQKSPQSTPVLTLSHKWLLLIGERQFYQIRMISIETNWRRQM